MTPDEIAALRELLNYNHADEERDYEESVAREDIEPGHGHHIFERILVLEAMLDRIEG